MNQPQYVQKFLGESKSGSDTYIIAEALKQALNIRKFEIGLYWKRTAYFWAFIMFVFAGYFQILTHRAELHHLTDTLLLLSAALGLVLSICWLCVNKGSKYWQENWENHVDMLEDYVTGPLYKIITEQSFSVSRINLVISTFFIVLWLIFLIAFLLEHVTFIPSHSGNIAWMEIVWGITTIVFAFIMIFYGKSKNSGLKRKTFYMRSNPIITNETPHDSP